MNEAIKKMLEEQVRILSEQSHQKGINTAEVIALSKAMALLANSLHEENQSFYAASTHHPYAVQLPVQDLIDLYAARDAHEGLELHACRMPAEENSVRAKKIAQALANELHKGVSCTDYEE